MGRTPMNGAYPYEWGVPLGRSPRSPRSPRQVQAARSRQVLILGRTPMNGAYPYEWGVPV
eukprot:6273225-Heterocapsa_arctica.AAC.1